MILDENGKGNDTTRIAGHAVRRAGRRTRCWGNAISGSLCATPAYYVFRHCSQYVQVGATVVKATGGDAIAFKNPDGSYVASCTTPARRGRTPSRSAARCFVLDAQQRLGDGLLRAVVPASMPRRPAR